MSYDQICKRLRQLAYNDNLRYSSRPNADGDNTECDKFYTTPQGAQSLQRLGVHCSPATSTPDGYKLGKYTYEMDPYAMIAHGLDTVSEAACAVYLPKKVKDMMAVIAMTDELNGVQAEHEITDDKISLLETLNHLKAKQAIRYVPATETQPMSILVSSDAGKSLRRKMVKTAPLTQIAERFLQSYDIGDCDRRINTKSLFDNSRLTESEKAQMSSWLETVEAPTKTQDRNR